MPFSMSHLWIPDTSLATDTSLALTMMARTWALRFPRPVAASQAEFYGVGAAATGTDTLSIPYYASPQANDIAFIFACSESSPTFGTVSGFTAEPQVSSGGIGARLYWKRLSGGESGNVSVTASGGADSFGVMAGFKNCISTGTPYEGYGALMIAGNTTMECANITTTGNNRLGVVMACVRDVWAATSPSSGWTEHVDMSDGGDGGFVVESLSIPSATTISDHSRNFSAAPSGIFAGSIFSLALIPNS